MDSTHAFVSVYNDLKTVTNLPQKSLSGIDSPENAQCFSWGFVYSGPSLDTLGGT